MIAPIDPNPSKWAGAIWVMTAMLGRAIRVSGAISPG